MPGFLFTVSIPKKGDGGVNFFELYDKLTGRWSRVRAHVFSHMVAAGLLWAVGFNPPLPAIAVPPLPALTGSSTPLLQSVGFLALISLAAAALAGLYTIVLDELGRVLMSIMFRIFPAHVHVERWERMVPPVAWFTVAATLPAGKQEAHDLRRRANELLSVYMMRHKARFAAAAKEDSDLHQDLYTHLRNSLLFLSTWLALPLLLPEGSALADEISRVYGEGAAVFLLYFIVSHARMAAISLRYYPRLYEVLAELIIADEAYAAKVVAAHAYPGPYWNLVSTTVHEEGRTEPSLKAYLGSKLRRTAAGEAALGAVHRLTRELDALKFSRSELEDYDRSDWLARYVQWRVVGTISRVSYRLREILRRAGGE